MKDRRRITGFFGLYFGLPAFLGRLFYKIYPGSSGDMDAFLPIGLVLSLSGYGLVRKDRILLFTASVLALIFLGLNLLAAGERFDDSAWLFIITVAYSLACTVMGRKAKDTDKTPNKPSSTESERHALQELYTTWPLEKLTAAVTENRDAYAPDALKLIEWEVARRKNA